MGGGNCCEKCCGDNGAGLEYDLLCANSYDLLCNDKGGWAGEVCSCKDMTRLCTILFDIAGTHVVCSI